MDIKIFKKKKKFVKRNLEKKLNFYWKSILYVTFILIFIFCVFGFYLFIKTNKELVLPINNVNEQDALKKESISIILDLFKDREKRSQEILNSSSPIVDPSL